MKTRQKNNIVGWRGAFFLSLFLSPGIAFAQQDTACMPLRELTVEQLAFQANERLTIVANYKWGIINTDVGEATMMLTKEKFRDTTYFYARAYAKTYRFYDHFFMVRDVYEARFLASNLRPLYFHRNISEGGYSIKNTYLFNNTDYTIRASVQRQDGAAKDTTLQGKSCTFDFVGLFYNSRNLDFEHFTQGQVIPISFAVDEEMFHIYYRYIGKEVKKISGLGTFRCIKISARPVAGEVFDGKNELFIWISDDKNHIPLLIETPIIVGKVSARLSKFANLKHPLSSKIK
ncbi:MAG: DUF3108 domain-containing protein [Prevotellaceae bacterium]|jgi:hypothetical protein|nr:DUF3108 domain-containing protein [Prevotellaceae bacterium]